MTTLKHHHLILAKHRLVNEGAANWLSNTCSQHVMVVLTNTVSIDSSSLKSLFEAHIELMNNNKKLVLINPSSAIRTLLYLTKIAEIIPYFVSVQDAIKHLQE